MSGKTKRTIYYVLSAVLLVASIAAVILMWIYGEGENYIFGLAIAAYLLFPLNVLVHEMGHLLVGLLCGMKFATVRVGHLVFVRDHGKFSCRFSLSNGTAGETAFYPTSSRRVKGRFLLTSLGGAMFNFIYAAVFGALYFVLPRTSAILFFEYFAPLSLYEGIMALLPVELLPGKTDGAVIMGLLKSNAEEAVALRVLTAQGMLHRKTFCELPKELLFDVPIVREDLPAYHALLILRVQYLLAAERQEEGRNELNRLLALSEYLSDEELEEVKRYAGYFEGNFKAAEGTLYGIVELEKRLEK